MGSPLDSGPYSRLYAHGMLHLPARRGAPVACDMSTAPDTPEERLAVYHALYAHALISRERSEGRVVLRFRGERATVEALARREAACCPFLDYRVEGDTVWTISGEASEVLDRF